MLQRWIPLLRSSIAIIVILSLSTVLVHWHEDKAGQDCGLCAAQQMPGLHGSTGVLLAAPILHEWRYVTRDNAPESTITPLSHFGRAPPVLS
jgi:hypothetical protein